MDKPLTVFLAEDDPVERALFVEAVREIDTAIECRTVNDGEAAMDFLTNPENEVPDFIFLDLRMPKIGGEKCLELIRQDLRLKDVPVIIFTTTQEVAISKNLMTLGASHFMSKPTDIDDIYFLISQVLNDNWR